jgi:hypothetical protein
MPEATRDESRLPPRKDVTEKPEETLNLEELTTKDAARIAQRGEETARSVGDLPDKLADTGDRLDRLEQLREEALRRSMKGG